MFEKLRRAEQRSRMTQKEEAPIEGEEATEIPVEEEVTAEEGTLPADASDGAEEWRDLYVRARADMENIRRRARLDVQDAHRFANERLLGDLLPVLDAFDRAVDAASQSDDIDALREGVQMIQRQLHDVLHRSGLREIEAAGRPFDPNQHEAVLQTAAGEGEEPGVVAEVLRPGYQVNDRVLRPSMVRVTVD